MTQRVVILDDDEETLGAASGLAGMRRRSSAAETFPLLAVSLALYAILNFTTDDGMMPWYKVQAFHVSQMSGDVWHVSYSDVFLSFSMLLLFIELVRATRRGGESLINHVFSAFVFIGALVLLMTQPGYGNSTFVIYMAMTALDVMAGFIITAIAWRRDSLFGPMM